MNFGFKSTFNKISRLRHSLRRNRRRNGIMILGFNLTSAGGSFALYYHNIIIPAVYASRPSGDLWMMAFKILSATWTASTLYAVTVVFLGRILISIEKYCIIALHWIDDLITRGLSLFLSPVRELIIRRKTNRS